jgi:tetratricopeptide (TPR) repeat protein
MRRVFPVVLASAVLLVAQPKPVEEAWNLLAAGKRDQAIHLLREITGRDPGNVDSHLLLGSVLAEAGQREEAILHLQQAVKLRPDSAEAHHALGEALQTFGEKKPARREFEATVRLDPDFAPARVNLGAVLVEAGELDLAAPQLDRAIELLGQKPDAAYPHYLRAKVHTERNEMQAVEADLNAAVSLRPDFAEAWSDLGQVRKINLDDAGALAAFRRAVSLSPDDAVAQTRLGAEYLHQANAHAAVPHLQEAVRLNPKNQSALYSLQMALREDGQAEAARQVRLKLVELLRERDQASEKALTAVQLNNQGADLEKSGNLRGAVEKYREALRLNPEHAGIRTNLAVALLRTGAWSEGIAELRDAIRRDPDNDNLKAALADALAKAPPGTNLIQPHKAR